MKTVKLVMWFLVISFIPVSASILLSEDVVADVLRVDNRVEARQEHRGDRQENTVDGAQDRQDSRQERHDCVGDGPDCRSDNRQDKHDDRQDRSIDRMKDRGERLN